MNFIISAWFLCAKKVPPVSILGLPNRGTQCYNLRTVFWAGQTRVIAEWSPNYARLLLFLFQKQIYAFSNCFASCYSMNITIFFQLLFCLSIKANTISNIFWLFCFWSASSWQRSITSLSVTH